MRSLDLCVVYTSETCRAGKFSEFINGLHDAALKETIETIYNAFDLFGFFCPEIGLIKNNAGIRLRYKDNDFYINITLMYSTPNKLFYVIGKVGDTEEYTSTTDKNSIIKIIKPYAPKRPIWKSN